MRWQEPPPGTDLSPIVVGPRVENRMRPITQSCRAFRDCGEGRYVRSWPETFLAVVHCPVPLRCCQKSVPWKMNYQPSQRPPRDAFSFFPLWSQRGLTSGLGDASCPRDPCPEDRQQNGMATWWENEPVDLARGGWAAAACRPLPVLLLTCPTRTWSGRDPVSLHPSSRLPRHPVGCAQPLSTSHPSHPPAPPPPAWTPAVAREVSPHCSRTPDCSVDREVASGLSSLHGH